MSSTSQDHTIAASLRDDILRGQYREGERLPSERDLARRFGVHRSTVREAFKRLEQLGVATIQRGGARVAPLEEASLDVVGHLLALDDPPDPEILDQAMEATSAFRAIVARLAAERANATQRARMLEILREMTQPELDGERRAALVGELGDCFVEASGNKILALMSRGLRSQREDTRNAGHVLPGSPDKELLQASLARLIEAIEQADGVAASETAYRISCLIRKNVRAYHSTAPDHRRLASGASS